jgi:hypothetical protein
MGATKAFGPPARSCEAPFGYSKQASCDKAGWQNVDVQKGYCQEDRSVIALLGIVDLATSYVSRQAVWLSGSNASHNIC